MDPFHAKESRNILTALSVLMGHVNILHSRKMPQGGMTEVSQWQGQNEHICKGDGEKSSPRAAPRLVFMRDVTPILLQSLPAKQAGKTIFRDPTMHSYPAPQRQQGHKHCIPPGHPDTTRPKTVAAQQLNAVQI